MVDVIELVCGVKYSFESTVKPALISFCGNVRENTPAGGDLRVFSETTGRDPVGVFEIGVETRKIRKADEFGDVYYFHIRRYQQVLRVTQFIIYQKFVGRRVEFVMEYSRKLHSGIVQNRT